MTEGEADIPGTEPSRGENIGLLDVTGISGGIQSPFQPTNPKMSEYKETAPGSGSWFARSGGTPKNDWSGIDETIPRAKKSTMQTHNCLVYML